MLFPRSVHVVASISAPFFSWPNNILLHGHTMLCILHLSTDGYAGGFHFLVRKNHAAINVHLRVFVQMCVFSSFGRIPGGDTARLHGNSMFNFWGESKVFSTSAVPFYIPNIWGLSGKVQSLLIQWEWYVHHQCNLAAKESGLECACMNNDDFTVPVSGAVSMCNVWLSHSRWLSK